MDAKSIALTITFAGLAMALNPAISGITFPFPLLPTLYFQVWEIPLIIAFLLFGFKVGVFADFINALFLVAVFPGPSQPYYITSALATFGTMLGIYAASKILLPKSWGKNPSSRAKVVSFAVALAIVCRTTIMAAVMFGILYFDPLSVYPPIPATYIVAMILPLQAVFNVIVPLYLVPSSYLIARLVSKGLTSGKQNNLASQL